MCVTFCHRRSVLFWNHEDCAGHCNLAYGQHGRCESCRHWRGAICWLTNAPLPEAGGCCHHNVAPAWGWQVVTRAMLEPLGAGAEETVADVLSRWDAPHRCLDEQGLAVVVDPDTLGIPIITYGVGTEAADEEPFPWPEEVLE